MRGLSQSRWASPSASTSRSARVAPSSTFPSSRLDGDLPLSSSSSSSPPPPSSSLIKGGSAGARSGAGRPSPQQELSRFLKIVSRIRWKLPFLDYGYKLATDHQAGLPGRTQQDIDASEIHFKIDFYEIYMHLERAIVHLLGVYGIDVHPSSSLPPSSSGGVNGSSSSSSSLVNGNGNGNGIADHEKVGKAAAPAQQRERIGQNRHQHQYHVNVLLALDDPENPLHAILGSGEPRRHLWMAKDLRNRWKTADSDAEAAAGARRARMVPLEAYNLEEMLQVILAALEEAYSVTLRYVQETAIAASSQNGDVTTTTMTTTATASSGSGSGMEEHDWGFIADAMDWEAV